MSKKIGFAEKLTKVVSEFYSYEVTDEEINTVEESAQKYFNVMFGYIYTKTHPIQTCGTLREKSIENRSKDLFFLNSIIEDETTFLSIEHFANILYNLEVEMEINTMRINCFDKVIEDIERKNPGSFEDYSESDKNDYLVSTDAKNDLLKQRLLLNTKIEQTKMNLYNSFTGAVEKFIMKRTQTLKEQLSVSINN